MLKYPEPRTVSVLTYNFRGTLDDEGVTCCREFVRILSNRGVPTMELHGTMNLTHSVSDRYYNYRFDSCQEVRVTVMTCEVGEGISPG